MSTLLEQAAKAAREARELAQKADAEGRNMTDDERATFDAKFAEATDKKARHDRGERPGKSVEEITKNWKSLDELMAAVGGAPGFENANHGGRSRWAKAAAERLTQAMPTVDGQKAIVSGTIGVPNVIEPDIVRIGQVPTTLLDLIPTKPATSDGRGGNSFTFLRQTTRTNNAAPVADGGTKPTSVYTIAEIEDRFRVVAHLSEAIPKRYFDDYSQLETFLESEMDYGLRLALQAEVLSGDGTGEHFTGILNTSGIVATPFSSDVFTTTRKAKTTLLNSGQAPTAYVFNPTDDEALDLAQDAEGGFYGDGPFKAGPQTLWGLPRVASPAVAAGTALLADWRLAELLVREDGNLAVDAGGTLFQKNQLQMRFEGRYGFAVLRPAAFASIDLTA